MNTPLIANNAASQPTGWSKK